MGTKISSLTRDTDITVGTLKKVAAFFGAGEGTVAEARRDWQAFQLLVQNYIEHALGEHLLSEVELTLVNGQVHRFDLAAENHSILIECKSYRWTSGGNEPAAKLAHAKGDAQMLLTAAAKRSLIVFEDDLHPKTQKSLAHLFVRRNRSWLGEVEVWRSWGGIFERIHPPMSAA